MQQPHYDDSPPCRRIDELYTAAEKLHGSSALFPAQFMQKVADNQIRPICLPTGNPATYRFLEDPDGGTGGGTTEFKFRIIGSVEKLDLPPFERRLMHSSRIRFLQQRIGIAAPGAEKFAANVVALFQALELISTLAPHHVDNSNISDACIMFGNRVFSAKDYAHEQDIVSIPNAMDPTGELTKAAAIAHLVHTEDNEVEYLRVNGADYLPITPVSIHCGDIIEIRFAVVLFHSTKTSLFSKLVLRAVISLDTSFAQALRFSNTAGTKPINLIPIRRKRVQDSIISTAPSAKKIRLTSNFGIADEYTDRDSPDSVRMVDYEISGLRLDSRSRHSSP